MRARSGLVIGIACAAVVAWPSSARAGDMPGLWPVGASGGGDSTPFDLNLDLFAQVEVGAEIALANFSDFGGVGGKLSLDIGGFGGAAGGRWEKDAQGRGGLGFVEGQLRPFELAQWRAYRVVDPYLAVGSELGGSTRGFRATAYGGAGVDIALWPSDTHPALTAEYVLRLPQTPGGFASQVLSLGVALRTVF